MCYSSWNSKKNSPFVLIRPHKKNKPHVRMTLRRKRTCFGTHLHRLRLKRRELRRAGAEMEVVNLKLYLVNRCIIAANERLRERAYTLRGENLALRANLCKEAMLLAASGC